MNRKINVSKMLRMMIVITFIVGCVLFFLTPWEDFHSQLRTIGMILIGIVVPVFALINVVVSRQAKKTNKADSSKVHGLVRGGLVTAGVGIVLSAGGALSPDTTLAPMGYLLLGIVTFFIGIILLTIGTIKSF